MKAVRVQLQTVKNIKEIFAENIRKFRTERGLTQDQLAESADLEYTAIQRYERAERWPRYENVTNIARALGVEEQDLFTPGQNAAVPIIPLTRINDMKLQVDHLKEVNKQLLKLNEDYLRALAAAMGMKGMLYVDGFLKTHPLLQGLVLSIVTMDSKHFVEAGAGPKELSTLESLVKRLSRGK